MDEALHRDPPQVGPYEFFMLGLSAYALLGLAASAVLGLSPGTKTILGYADVVVCGFFFADFLGQLYRAPDRPRYLMSWGWLDLASSVPFVDALRLGRAGRVVRMVRVLRGAKSAKQLATYLLARRAQGTFFAVSLVSLVLLVFASASVLQFEASGSGNIKSPEDALWWAFTTITPQEAEQESELLAGVDQSLEDRGWRSLG